jgi:hypothetical protein
MPEDWYAVEFTIATADGQIHGRTKAYPTRREAAMVMHKEISMGEWDKWYMVRQPHPPLMPETRPEDEEERHARATPTPRGPDECRPTVV